MKKCTINGPEQEFDSHSNLKYVIFVLSFCLVLQFSIQITI